MKYQKKIYLTFQNIFYKVHIFWEGHKILRNIHHRFVLFSVSQICGGDFAKFVVFSEYINFHYRVSYKYLDDFLGCFEVAVWLKVIFVNNGRSVNSKAPLESLFNCLVKIDKKGSSCHVCACNLTVKKQMFSCACSSLRKKNQYPSHQMFIRLKVR